MSTSASSQLDSGIGIGIGIDIETVISPRLDAYLATNDFDSYHPLLSLLSTLVQNLARDQGYRDALASSPSSAPLAYLVRICTSIWSSFLSNSERAQAKTVEQRRAESNAGDDGSSYKEHNDPAYRDVQLLTLALRCCRNAMARCPPAQLAIAAHLTQLQPIFVHLTAFTALTDPDLIPLSRTCAQLLSNLITSNQDTQRQVWQETVLASSSPSPEKRLVHRLLTSPDTPTQLATQILLINLLKLPNDPQLSHDRCLALSTDPAGLEIVETLLNLADSIVLQTSTHPDDDDAEFKTPSSSAAGAGAGNAAPTAAAQASHQQLEESLRLINEIFRLLFAQGMASNLLRGLAPIETISSDAPEAATMDRPVVNASQMTLLKLLDSWLHFGIAAAAASDAGHEDAVSFSPSSTSHLGGLEELVALFLHLSRFVRTAMAKGLEDRDRQDKRVVGVHQVLLLVLQCLLSLGLVADGWSVSAPTTAPPDSTSDKGLKAVSCAYLSTLREDREFVEELVALLHQTALFAPPVSPFKPTLNPDGNGPNSTSTSTTMPLPEGHVLSSTGSAAASAGGEDEKRYGFDHLKRDIVRVLGTLVYSPFPASSSTGGGEATSDPAAAAARNETVRQIRAVQDLVREAGGLWDVMNMTVLDERNPYMREHAIFTLRYLLAGNLESQDLVKRLQPLDRQSDNGGGGGGGGGGAGLQLPVS
ncbi:uncharacterized protein PFL1_01230 [Pseudozyma flocculosa PF-1]|uniref:Ataxin-10 homolog n=1 Tax=Pseudozyma flocculosa TaxID=84751 RepID=A0A5C3EVW4_9BASI|nr:uncharacterized protein PFL1_01230 [Pseudozyma flocculosa PF-1]EPQ31041.1 hypothetical protein PFL1_01230 [Pseudozyma flocculosa PF-1]SPO35885.1 uncharacterized protein PSFLO_01356 [Pseudozyma flocculosa]